MPARSLSKRRTLYGNVGSSAISRWGYGCVWMFQRVYEP